MQSRKSLLWLSAASITISAFLPFIRGVYWKYFRADQRQDGSASNSSQRNPGVLAERSHVSQNQHQAEHSSRQAVKKAGKTPAQLPHTALLNKLISSPTGAFPVPQLTCWARGFAWLRWHGEFQPHLHGHSLWDGFPRSEFASLSSQGCGVKWFSGALGLRNDRAAQQHTEPREGNLPSLQGVGKDQPLLREMWHCWWGHHCSHSSPLHFHLPCWGVAAEGTLAKAKRNTPLIPGAVIMDHTFNLKSPSCVLFLRPQVPEMSLNYPSLKGRLPFQEAFRSKKRNMNIFLDFSSPFCPFCHAELAYYRMPG